MTYFEECTLEEIDDRINSLQKTGNRWSTNYFRQALTGATYWMSTDDDGVIFMHNDMHFSRLYYFIKASARFADKFGVLSEWDRDIVAGVIGRPPDPNVGAGFESAGFNKIAAFLRMQNRSLRVAQANNRLSYPAVNEAETLLGYIRRDFDPLTGHFPTQEMLEQYIANNWVLVSRCEGEINAYIVFQVNGIQMNYNYASSWCSNPLDWSLLQNNFYASLYAQGVKFGVLWVDELNTRVITMHKALGWTFDGLTDHFFLKKRFYHESDLRRSLPDSARV